MKIENTEVYGFRRALYGMRNPLNSWDKSDTVFEIFDYVDDPKPSIYVVENPKIGPRDMELCCKLIKGGFSSQKVLTANNDMGRYNFAKIYLART